MAEYTVTKRLALPKDLDLNVAWVSAYPSFAYAVSAQGLTDDIKLVVDREITISGGDQPVPENVTLEVLPGGMFNIALGFTLTINGPFICGLTQCFTGEGAAIVRFGPGVIDAGRPEWWGAKADGETDNTTTIQNCINCVRNSDICVVQFSSGEYLFTKLYLYHDATLNPNYATGIHAPGRIHLRGIGEDDWNTWSVPTKMYTYLRSTDATGPAISLIGTKGDVGGENGGDIHISDMTIEAANTTWVIQIVWGAWSSFKNLMLAQRNTSGSGFYIDESWGVVFDRMRITGPDSSTKAATGLKIVSTIRYAGGFILDSVMIRWFDTGWQLGETLRADGNVIRKVYCRRLNIADCNNGLDIGSEITDSELSGTIAIVSVSGVKIHSDVRRLDLMLNVTGVGDLVVIGSPIAEENRAEMVRLHNSRIDVVGDVGTANQPLKIYSGNHIKNITLDDVKIKYSKGDTVDHPIELDEVRYSNLRLNNLLYSDNWTGDYLIANSDGTVDTSIYAQEIWEDNLVKYQSLHNDQLEEPPFQFKQLRTAASQPPVQLYQACPDNGFMQIRKQQGWSGGEYVNLTKLDGSGDVQGPKRVPGGTSGNGWSFFGMMAVEVLAGPTATEATVYWMPLYKPHQL